MKKINYCELCKKPLNKNSFYAKTKRCIKCKNIGHKHSVETKEKIRKAHQGRKRTQEFINKIKKALHHHHIDLNTTNNIKSNILLLKNTKHQHLHRFAYHYLLYKFGIKEIRKYIKWFMKNYSKLTGKYIRRKVILTI
jgi:hypothetical protein